MRRSAFLILFIFIAGLVSASDVDFERQSLKGLKGLRVACHLQSNVSLSGFQEAQLQQDIENRIQGAGISIPFSVQYDKNPLDYGVLHVNVVIVYHKTAGFYFYTNTLEILQYCTLSRDRKYEAMMPTWTEGFSGGDANLSEIRKTILNNIDTVIDAYLSVNTK
jgi:hypothetical protein